MLAWVGRPADTKPVSEQIVQHSLVQFRQRDGVPEQSGPVERAPRPVLGLHAVGHHHVGVQVRVNATFASAQPSTTSIASRCA
jgi:hypothetical protein